MKTTAMRFGIRLILFAGFIVAIAFITIRLLENEYAQNIITQFGYFGLVLISLVSGFNILVPIPAVSFSPFFLVSGFSPFEVVTAIILGTTCADLIAFYLGSIGRVYLKENVGHWYERLEAMRARDSHLPLIILFLFAAFMPLPNELVLVPLGLLGLKLRAVLLPLLAGTTIHVSLLVLGINGLLEHATGFL